MPGIRSIGTCGGCCSSGICDNDYYEIGAVESFDEVETKAGFYEEFRFYEPAYASYTRSGNTVSATAHTINPELRGYAGGSNVLKAEYLGRGFNFKWEATTNPILIATLDFEWTTGWSIGPYRQFERLAQLSVAGVTSQANQTVITNPFGVAISFYNGNTGRLQVILDARTGINRAWRPAFDGDQNNITSAFGDPSAYCDISIVWTIRVLNAGDSRLNQQPYFPCVGILRNLDVRATT